MTKEESKDVKICLIHNEILLTDEEAAVHQESFLCRPITVTLDEAKFLQETVHPIANRI